MTKREEKILVKRCIACKPDAQKKLYDQFAQDMFRVCRSYAPNYEMANDYLQEGFIKVFQKLHLYKPTGSLGGWIRRVMVNNCVDLIRRDTWTMHKIHLEEFMEFGIAENEATTLKKINTDSFFEILHELPVGYRTVLNLYFVEEYKHHEIAELLGVSVGTSKSQLSKAKKYLKEILVNSMSVEEIELYVGRLAKEVV